MDKTGIKKKEGIKMLRYSDSWARRHLQRKTRFGNKFVYAFRVPGTPEAGRLAILRLNMPKEK